MNTTTIPVASDGKPRFRVVIEQVLPPRDGNNYESAVELVSLRLHSVDIGAIVATALGLPQRPTFLATPGPVAAPPDGRRIQATPGNPNASYGGVQPLRVNPEDVKLA